MSGDEKPSYEIRATTAGGDERRLSVPADRPVEELVREFAARGLRVSELRGRRARRLFEPRRVSLESFAVFNSELAAACRRNVPLPEALRVLSRDMAGRRMREAVEAVAARVESGADFGAALAERPKDFPPAYVALVRAGLSSGDLAGTLLLFSEEARLAGRVRRNTISAVAYPLAMILVAAMVMALAGWVLAPVIIDSFLGYDEARLSTLDILCLLGLRFGPFVFAVGILLVFQAWTAFSRRVGGAAILGRLVLRVPLFGRFHRAVAMVRFCKMLASALTIRTGVPEAMVLAGLATGNAALQAAAARAASAIGEGRPISEALRSCGHIFPATLVWMLSLGEQRGDVAGALSEYGRLQEETVDRLGRVVPTVVATLATILAALVLLLSILAVMSPIFTAMFRMGDMAQ